VARSSATDSWQLIVEKNDVDILLIQDLQRTLTGFCFYEIKAEVFIHERISYSVVAQDAIDARSDPGLIIYYQYI